MITARIKRAKEGGLYLIIDDKDVAWAIEEDEIEPIKIACEKYLNNKETK